MRIPRTSEARDKNGLGTTPLIDVVFQLLIFFLLSAKFLGLQEELSSNLPKERGPGEDAIEPLARVTFSLQWRPEGAAGRVRCFTHPYFPPEGGAAEAVHEFATVRSGPVPYGPRGELVDFGYGVPDLGEIERYIESRSAAYGGMGELAGAAAGGLPVAVRFEDQVPCQMVVTLLDICKRVGIEKFDIGLAEGGYD